MALSLVGVLVILVELGVAPAIIQRTTIEREHLGGGFAVILLTGTLAVLLNLAVAEPLSRLMGMPELVGPLMAFSIIVVLQPYVVIMDAVVRRSLKFRTLAFADIAGSLFGYAAISIIAALNGFGLWSLVLGQIGTLAVRGAVLAYAAGFVWAWRTSRGHMKDILDFGTFFSISRMATYFGQRFDRVMVGGLLGAESAGLYQRIQNILFLTYRQVTEPLDQVLFPIMARVQDAPERLWNGFGAATAGTALLTMPMTVIAIVVSPAFVPIIFGPNWTPMIPPLQILLLITITRPSDAIAGITCRATGRVKMLALINTVYALMVIGAVIVGHTYGLIGVAWCVLGAAMVKFLLTNSLIRRILGISLLKSLSPFKSGVTIALCVTAIALLIHAIAGDWLWTPLGAFAFLVPAMAVWMGLMLYLPGSMLPPELSKIRTQGLARLLHRPPT